MGSSSSSTSSSNGSSQLINRREGTVYVGGDRVVYKDKAYQARWWHRGADPGSGL